MCRWSRDGDLCTFLETVLDERNSLCTIGICGLPGDDRRFGCAQREGDGVIVLSRCEARNKFAIHIDSRQSVVRELSYGEVERIGVGGGAISRRYVDSGNACGVGSLCDSHSSTSILCSSSNNGHFGCTIRQRHVVGVEVRIEASDSGTINLNVRQASIVGCCGNELNLIGSGAATISSMDLNNHRIAIDSALLHDLALLAGEFATRESGSVAAGIGDGTYTAHAKHSRDLSGFAH